MRVTLDSNVYVSAFNFGGVPAELLKLAAQDQFQLQLSPPILDETARVLINKFHWSLPDWTAAVHILEAISQRVIPAIELAIYRDPDDNRVLECSQMSCSEYLVTGDTDLLVMRRHERASIVKPAEFLAVLLGEPGQTSGAPR